MGSTGTGSGGGAHWGWDQDRDRERGGTGTVGERRDQARNQAWRDNRDRDGVRCTVTGPREELGWGAGRRERTGTGLGASPGQGRGELDEDVTVPLLSPAVPGAQHGGPGSRPGPGADDLQRGGRGDRQGGRAAPAHAAAFAPLPGESCGGLGVLKPPRWLTDSSHPCPFTQALERRAAPLPGGEEGEYMLALKQELRRAMRGLPYFVKPGAPRRGTQM